jgi:hypothetical protein
LKHFFYVIAILFIGCASKKKHVTAFNYVYNHKDPNLQRIFTNPKKYEVQILYTRVSEEPQKINFNTDYYLAKSNAYFYPASVVKLPIAILALEKLSRNKEINLTTKYKIQDDTTDYSIYDDITDVLILSGNESFNRLFDFVGGQDSINARLKTLNIEAQIKHRLSIPNSDDVKTKEIVFEKNIVFPSIQSQPIKKLSINNLQKGKGYYQNDTLISEPMDFSLKNYYPIEAMHNTLMRIFFPTSFLKSQRFHLTKENMIFLKETLKKVPRKADFLDNEYHDSYGKFFMYGDSKKNIPDHIEIYNKVGQAYGTLTDCAYVVDTKKNIAFFLTVTLLVNENEIFNDDVYEYDSVGIPFMASLGRAFYEYEMKNK